MTATTWLSAPTNLTDADFRAWGLAMSNALAAIGLTQTADTGQINWATVVKAAVSTDAGYEIWRFNDSAQSSKPVYIRIDYGTAASSTNNPRVKWTIGTGSNGAGTIINPWVNGQHYGSNSSSTTQSASYACYDATLGFFWIANWHGHSAANSFIGHVFLGRAWSEDESSQEDDYMLWLTTNNAAFSAFQLYRHSFGRSIDCYIPSAAPAQSGNWGNGSTKYYARVYAPGGDRILSLPGMLLVGASDFADGASLAITPVATSRTYIAMTNPNVYGLAYPGASNANVRPLCLWQ